MRGQSALFAGALLAATLMAAPQATAQTYHGSDPYCAQQRQNRMLLGAAIGAAAGAVLGNNVAARNAQTEGAVVGGVAGGATGAMIGRSTVKCAPPRVAYEPAPAPAGYGYGSPVGYDQYGPVRPAPTPDYGRPTGGQNCRWGENIMRDPEGREMRESVYMCRGRDGVWRRQG
jgi:YMGG-like Gly-zipper